MQRISLTTEKTFDCARTCPAHEAKTNGLYLCRFNPLFRAIGATPTVHSHTVKVKVDYTDPDALRGAVLALGWKWLGAGTHRLFSGNTATGHGFHIPNWQHPCILQEDGTLAFDDYHGHWGNVKDLDQLKAAYLTATVETAAKNLGWQYERTPQGITVYEPNGGILNVSNEGVCDTTNFVGTGCHDARTALGLMAEGTAVNKAEIDHLPAVIQQPN